MAKDKAHLRISFNADGSGYTVQIYSPLIYQATGKRYAACGWPLTMKDADELATLIEKRHYEFFREAPDPEVKLVEEVRK